MKQALLPDSGSEPKLQTNPSLINSSSLDKSEQGWDGEKAFGQDGMRLSTGSPADARGMARSEGVGAGGVRGACSRKTQAIFH